jgi:hypothetical protein
VDGHLQCSHALATGLRVLTSLAKPGLSTRPFNSAVRAGASRALGLQACHTERQRPLHPGRLTKRALPDSAFRARFSGSYLEDFQVAATGPALGLYCQLGQFSPTFQSGFAN